MPLGIAADSARAEVTGPVWKILAVSNPTNFKPGDKSGGDAIVVTAVNVGGSSTGCTAEQLAAEPRPAFSPVPPCNHASPVVSPVTISDVLPEGLTAVQAFGVDAYHDPLGVTHESSYIHFYGEDLGPPFGLACTFSARTPSCTIGEPVAPGDTLVMTVKVHIESKVQGSGEVNRASVSGGGAAGASVSDPVTISSTPAEYGIVKGGVFSALSTTQAGAHPNVTAEFFLNTINQPGGDQQEDLWVENVHYPKDVHFSLPVGLVGTTVGMPRCTMAEVVEESKCPRDTMVGAATLMVVATGASPRIILTVPVYNIAPAPGEPAAFALDALFFPVRLDTSVLSDGEYNVRVGVPDITGGGSAYMASITIWGDPAEHNGPGPDAGARSLSAYGFLLGQFPAPEVDFGGPGTEEVYVAGVPSETVSEKRVALLTNPTQCSTPLAADLESDAWAAPGVFAIERVPVGTATGCGQLSFKPGVSMLPDTLEAGAPAGYSFDLSVPQNVEADGLATPDVKRTVVTLPLGTVVSPSVCGWVGGLHERGVLRPRG